MTIYNVLYDLVKHQSMGCFYIYFNCLGSTQGKKPRVVQDVQTRTHILAAATFKVVVLGFFSLTLPLPSAWPPSARIYAIFQSSQYILYVLSQPLIFAKCGGTYQVSLPITSGPAFLINLLQVILFLFSFPIT